MEKDKGGRPTKYKPEYAALALNYCKLGAEDKQLAEFFEVAESTINKWKLDHDEFSESISIGKDFFNTERVERALIHSALGYTHDSEKIFLDKEGNIVRAETIEHYPPNASSLIFFLKNRDRNRWKDRQDHEHSGKGGTPLQAVLNIGKSTENK